ncbi:Mariner Mos1 transposase [Araneus ventricosus]|uniref:Mariner Mos1 transposase n=1 Tax=Araneus ventricosus TaxID=182803 RepID=A0A4Y2C3N7_ARAVE|nr:Mariner Mos1 transposase [Araneus ventricosus]
MRPIPPQTARSTEAGLRRFRTPGSRKGGWSAPGESSGSVARRALTNKKVLPCIWWDCRRIIYKEYLNSRQTINSAIYSNILIKVRNAILEKRRNEFRRKVVLFHQDYTRPYVSTMTGWALYKLEWDLMQHPPYSLDMAPSDFYLLSHLQLNLDGEVFNSNEEVINEVDLFLDSRTPQFFAEGIEKFPKCWETIVGLN